MEDITSRHGYWTPDGSLIFTAETKSPGDEPPKWWQILLLAFITGLIVSLLTH